jgi:hypothetical protein
MTEKDGTSLSVIIFLTAQKGKILPYVVEYNNAMTFGRFEQQTARFIDFLKVGD